MAEFFVASRENCENSAGKRVDDHRDDIAQLPRGKRRETEAFRQQCQQPAVKQIMAGNEGGETGGISVGRFIVPGGQEVCPATHSLSERFPAVLPR